MWTRTTSPRRRRLPSSLVAAALALVACKSDGGMDVEYGLAWSFIDQSYESAHWGHHSDSISRVDADGGPVVFLKFRNQLSPQRIVVVREREPLPPTPPDVSLQPTTVVEAEEAAPVIEPLPESEVPDTDHGEEVGENGSMVIPFIGEIAVRIPQGDWKMALALAMIVFGAAAAIWAWRRERLGPAPGAPPEGE